MEKPAAPLVTQIETKVAGANWGTARMGARILAAGGLVAFPTETVYGLGADAENGEAVARLYAAKGRPKFNPLICHVLDVTAARALAQFDTVAEMLAAAFWPGPLTLVLPKAAHCPVSELATAGLDTIAIRAPSHPVARDLLKAFGKSVVAPSANRSGHVSPTEAKHVLADMRKRIEFIIDGGSTPVGIESTIVACLGAPMLLRPGGLPRSEIERVLGHALVSSPATDDLQERPLAPGQLTSHYAPRTPLRLDAHSVAPDEALLAFGPALPPGAERARQVLNLSARADLVEAAANLFAHLRTLDSAGAIAIAVMPIPNTGLGEAINDRLGRAAAPRQ